MARNLVQGDILECRFVCQNRLQQAVNTIHYQVGAVTGGTLTDSQVAPLIDLRAAPLYKAWLPTACSYRGSRIQVVFQKPLQVAVVTTANSGIGAKVGDPLPSVAAYLMKKQTTLAGPKGQGRIFLPFWSEDENDATGKPGATAIVLATAFATQMLGPFGVTVGGAVTTLTPGVYSRKFSTFINLASVVLRGEWYHIDRRSESGKPDLIGP